MLTFVRLGVLSQCNVTGDLRLQQRQLLRAVEAVMDPCQVYPALEQIQRLLVALYRAQRDSFPSDSDEARAVQTEQRNWYNGVRASCNSKECVESRYRARITALQGMRR